MTDINNDKSADLLIEMTAEIVAAFASSNHVAADELPNLISQVHSALGGAMMPVEVIPEKEEPAVSVRRSIQNDHLVCLEDGRKFKSLKRHLKSEHGLSAEQYREKWNLPASYPMVAPAYAEERARLAREMGLGQRRKK